MRPRKVFAIMAVLCAVCAVLIAAASSLGAQRPEQEFTGAPPRSILSADYGVDTNVQHTAPLRPEIAEAAARDTKALGVALRGTYLAREADALAAEAVEPAPASSRAPFGIPAPAAVPVTPTAIAAAVLAMTIGAAWLVLRPSRD